MDLPWGERKYIRMLSGASVTSINTIEGEIINLAINFENDVKDDNILWLTALTDARACVFSYDGFRKMIDRDYRMGVMYADTFKSSMVAIVRMFWVREGKTLFDKALRLFSMLGGGGIADADGFVHLTHDDLARLLKADRSSITSIMKQLREQEYIEGGYGKVKLLNKIVETVIIDRYYLG